MARAHGGAAGPAGGHRARAAQTRRELAATGKPARGRQLGGGSCRGLRAPRRRFAAHQGHQRRYGFLDYCAVRKISPLILRSRSSGVSKDEATIRASWFETALPRLLTMRIKIQDF